MSDKQGVIDALLAALAANPGDEGIRMHLAELLMAEGQYEQAADHYAHVLHGNPAQIQALKGACKAQKLLGNLDKAQGYEKILSALGEGGPAPVHSAAGDSNQARDGAQHDQTTDTTTPTGSASSNVTRLRIVEGGAPEVEPWEDPEPPITLADVGGMEHVKKRLNMSFLAPLKNPEMMKMYGKSLRGGLLLYGPPGCGKTYIARALAGELGAKFMSIGLSDVLDMYFGESERKLHELFETARRQAPCVLFIDEIDALGQKRSQLSQSGGRKIVNQLLVELDSVGADNKNVFILAATNHPWDVDTALRRPGRFDRSVLVLPPDEKARQAILNLSLDGKPVDGLDLIDIARRTEYFSGADLVHLCNSAVEIVLEESLASGEARPITMVDFRAALKDVRPSTRPWFDTAKNYAMFANEGGAYDELLEYIKAHRI